MRSMNSWASRVRRYLVRATQITALPALIIAAPGLAPTIEPAASLTMARGESVVPALRSGKPLRMSTKQLLNYKVVAFPRTYYIQTQDPQPTGNGQVCTIYLIGTSGGEHIEWLHNGNYVPAVDDQTTIISWPTSSYSVEARIFILGSYVDKAELYINVYGPSTDACL